MNLVAASFAWPFRGDWRPRWLVGVVMVLIPVTNYLCNRFWVFLPGIEPPTRAVKSSPRASGKS